MTRMLATNEFHLSAADSLDLHLHLLLVFPLDLEHFVFDLDIATWYHGLMAIQIPLFRSLHLRGIIDFRNPTLLGLHDFDQRALSWSLCTLPEVLKCFGITTSEIEIDPLEFFLDLGLVAQVRSVLLNLIGINYNTMAKMHRTFIFYL